MTRVLLVAALMVPTAAFACGGSKTKVADAETANAEQEVAAAAVDPTHCAKKAELVGSNCSYTTGMMAQRVLEEGKSWSYTGSLSAATNDLESNVAAPYTVGPEGAINIIANEVVERLIEAKGDTKRVALTGKLLDVDGTTYFVATDIQEANS